MDESKNTMDENEVMETLNEAAAKAGCAKIGNYIKCDSKLGRVIGYAVDNGRLLYVTGSEGSIKAIGAGRADGVFAEVRKARLEKDDEGKYVCTQCGAAFDSFEIASRYSEASRNFCQNCGARLVD